MNPNVKENTKIFVRDLHSSIEENYNIFNECGLILRPNSKIINVEIQVLKSKSKKNIIKKYIYKKKYKNYTKKK